jgi:carbamoyl-phosphate synthase large subunit
MASRRLLVMAAGTGASNNLVRSLRAGNADVHVVGCNDDRFTLKQSAADRLYLTPPTTAPAFASALLRLLDHERIDLVIPSGDGDVLALSALRGALGSRCFLPAPHVIDLCRDKFALAQFLSSRDVPVPATCAVGGLDDLGALFTTLGRGRPRWCPAREGRR